MRIVLSLILTIAPGLLIAGCGSRPQPPTLVPSGDLLPVWNYATAAAVVGRPPTSACVPEPIRGSLVGLELLGWRVIDRPDGQRDEALWWGYFLSADGPAWLLAMTFRDEGANTAAVWRFSRTTPWTTPCGRAIYSRLGVAPTLRDVEEFYRTSGAAEVMQLPQGVDPGDWFHPAFLPGSRWALRRAIVRSAAWERVFGSEPSPAFQP